jgi:hypothetical protein
MTETANADRLMTLRTSTAAVCCSRDSPECDRAVYYASRRAARRASGLGVAAAVEARASVLGVAGAAAVAAEVVAIE